jgi:phenylacetate-CoA ligase
VALVNSSGTTDDKITNIWNQKWWDRAERASWKLNSHMSQYATGDHREAILVNPKNVGIISDDIDLPMEKRRLARFLYLNEKTDPLRWSAAHLERMVRELNIYQPAVLEANPSYLAWFARHLAAAGKKVFQPAVIVFTYEYPTRLHYRQIKRVFPKVPTVSSYGTTETGYVFMQCEKGQWHQNADYCRVDFQPFKKIHGGPLVGRILVTPLRNPWSYLLRFDTGDIVEVEKSGRCACGRHSGMILSSLQGRQVNLTLNTRGRLVTLAKLDRAVSRLAGIEEYQLTQTQPTEYQLTLVSERPDRAALRAEADDMLKKLYGEEARVTVNFKSAIGPEESGKYLAARTLFPLDLTYYLE